MYGQSCMEKKPRVTVFRTCSGCLPRCNGLRCFFHWAIWPETAPSPVLIGPQLQCYTNSKQFVITWKFILIRMRWTPSCQLLKFLCSYFFSVDLTPRHCGIEVLSSRVVLLLLVAKEWRDCLQSLDPPVSWFLCCLGWENFNLRKGTWIILNLLLRQLTLGSCKNPGVTASEISAAGCCTTQEWHSFGNQFLWQANPRNWPTLSILWGTGNHDNCSSANFNSG